MSPEADKGRARPAAWAASLLLLSVGVLLGLLLAELAVRLARRQAVLIISDELYAVEEPDGFGLQPGYQGEITNRVEFTHGVSVNRAGLRGPEVEPTDEGLRILLMGDSFTFGVGVEQEETLGAVLAGLYAAEGRAAIALNAGVPGYGAPDAAARFDRLAPELRPDLVVMSLFTGNDLFEATSPHAGVRQGLPTRGQGGASASFREWLYYHSDLFVLVKTSVPTRSYAKVARWLGREEPTRVRRLRQASEVYRRDPPTWVGEGLAATRQALVRMAAGSRDLGARFAVLIIPELLQIEPDRLTRALEDLDQDPGAYDPQAPTALFAQMLTEEGWPFLDLTPILAAAHEKGDGPYYPIDRHWTPAGHRLVARAAKDLLDGLDATP